VSTELPTFNNRGTRWPLELKQGATFGPNRIVINDPITSAPVDLTGCVLRGQVRRSALDAAVAATFDVTMAPDPLEGWFEFGLTDEATSQLVAGAKIADPNSRYEYDIELEDASGRVLEVLWGPLLVAAEVTRPAP
jgi:hypothetical protein